MLELNIYPIDGRRVWHYFAPHHYLSGKYCGQRAFVACLPDGTLVGFMSSRRFPHAKILNAWREHRTVVLPDYQGLGVGVRLSEWLAEWHVQQGQRFYSRTSHPRMGEYRNASPHWRNTTSNRKRQSPKGENGLATWNVDLDRVCYSHEYLGRDFVVPQGT